MLAKKQSGYFFSFAELDEDDDESESTAIEGMTPSGDRRRLFSKELRLLVTTVGI